MSRRRTLRSTALAVSIGLFASACGGDGSGSNAASNPERTPASAATSEVIEPAEITPEVSAVAPAGAGELPGTGPPWTVRPSVNQLHVVGAVPGAELELIDRSGVSSSAVVDDQGALLWRDIAAGEYQVRSVGEPVEVSDVVVVTDPDDIPERSFYADQRIDEGFGYITTRDGTTLSATVWLPGPVDDGPFPTVVEYSGYSPSNPDDSSSAQLFTTLGYAYVGVNMRGTGCSGGSFEFFEPVQLTDGYDVIEAVAAQPWVAHGQVGMVGVSYPGISQLFVASTRPPNLAAITPLSVLDDAVKSTLYPGGILNTGFARAWSDEREADAEPYGQGWERGIVDAGDTTCADNQLLRLQNTDAARLIADNATYTAELGDPIAPHLLVGDIEVPVFLAGAWQDEQTGGHFPAMLDDFDAAPQLYATMVNGSHTESIASLAIFERYVEFLELYVARRVPDLTRAALIAPVLTTGLTGASGMSLPTGNRFTGMVFEEALAAYEAQDPVRILFEEGAADGQPPGTPLHRFEAGFQDWPPAGVATSWYLTGDGTLTRTPATNEAAASEYVSDPTNLPPVTFQGSASDVWAVDATYDWRAIPAGTGLGWISAPLDTTMVAIGSGSVDLWLRSSAEDTDIEVSVSEVRPDGTEVYVQSGWLRASHRAFDESASTETSVVRSYTAADAATLPPEEFSLTRVEVFPFAHAFRAGSRLRLTVDAPGGARPLWAFAETIADGETNEVAHDAAHPSRLVLNIVDGIEVPSDPPGCGALRSQPCRPYRTLIGG